MPSTTVSNLTYPEGAAHNIQLDKHTVERVLNARVGDTINLTYSVDVVDDMPLKAKVTITVVDEHKLFGENVTIYDVLGMIMRQVAETRLS